MRWGHVWFTIAALIAVFGLLFYRNHSKTIGQNDSAAIGQLRQLSGIQAAYLAHHPAKGFACSLAELSATEVYSGFRFQLECEKGQKGDAVKYRLIAEPLERDKTGLRTYCITEERSIWFDEHGSAADCVRTRKPVSN